MISNNEILELLNRNTIRDDTNGCWLYQSTNIPDGYGRLAIDNVQYLTHRLSAYVYLGLNLFDYRLQANHKPICKNKNCWNPDHIYVGTQADNMKDEKGIARKDTCKLGHNLDGKIWLRKSKKWRRYCRICHNRQSKLSERNLGHSAQKRYKERNRK